MLKNILLVGLGGFLGSVSRYLIYWLIDKRLDSLYPWATFAVNIAGSLFLGILLGSLTKTGTASDHLRLLLAVGFCGSFTTFSSFMFENLFLFQQKAAIMAIVYIAGSLLLGFLAVFSGLFIGKTLF